MAKLKAQIKSNLVLYDADRAEQCWVDFRKNLAEVQQSDTPEGDAALLTDDYEVSEETEGLLRFVFSTSPYLTAQIMRDPKFLVTIVETEPQALLQALAVGLEEDLRETPAFDRAMHILRVYKNQVALTIALADIAGVFGVGETTETLSRAADQVLQQAVRYLFARAGAKGDYLPQDAQEPEKGCGYIVIGMGKYGAFELNYSSDIDLIIFYDAENVTFRDGVEAPMFYIRLTRDLVKLLQERTADGYVFRTDLRLRPDPGATQVALSTEAGLIYYESFGQSWERAAMIKARFVAGDEVAGQEFLHQLSPFVWRNYLDYAAIADVHAMKRQIHAYKGHGSIAVKGHNIKLGRGGIREIEFFVQTQQLIAGGRQPELRVSRTLEALNRLVDNKWVAEHVASQLKQNYLFLRHVEHRLQMIADEQTHTLPEGDEELVRVARFSGFEKAEDFFVALRTCLESVQSFYGELFEDQIGESEGSARFNFSGVDDDPQTLVNLQELGFQNAEAAAAKVRTWLAGRYGATRSERARERLSELLPTLLECLGDTSEPDLGLAAFDKFLSELPTGVQLFSLLRNNPSLLRLMTNMMGTTPRLAQIMTRRPKVLDAVLDPGFFGDLPTDQELKDLVDHAFDEATDFQDALDLSRRVGQEQAFLTGVRVLSGTITAGQAGTAYANLADHLIDGLKDQAEEDMIRAHGRLKDGVWGVLAMGKLGGREMTASSDLDLIVVYDFDPDCTGSDGAKPLSGMQYFTRLTQRLVTALSSPTAEGTLYEVDMRLRPSGRSGPVATQLASFIEYHDKQSWTWEHMALTRARVVTSEPGLQSQVEAIIHEVLTRPHPPEQLATDILEMRARLEKERQTDNIWHIKNVRGGLVDLEFIAQYLQLAHAHEAPEILDTNTATALNKVARAGFLESAAAEELGLAAERYHNLTQILRLSVDEAFDPTRAPEGLKGLLMRALDAPDFARVESDLRESLSTVKAHFDKIIDPGRAAST